MSAELLKRQCRANAIVRRFHASFPDRWLAATLRILQRRRIALTVLKTATRVSSASAQMSVVGSVHEKNSIDDDRGCCPVSRLVPHRPVPFPFNRIFLAHRNSPWSPKVAPMAGGGVPGASAGTPPIFGHMPDGSNTYRPDCPQGYWVGPWGNAATRRITAGCRAATTDRAYGPAPVHFRNHDAEDAAGTVSGRRPCDTRHRNTIRAAARCLEFLNPDGK